MTARDVDRLDHAESKLGPRHQRSHGGTQDRSVGLIGCPNSRRGGSGMERRPRRLMEALDRRPDGCPRTLARDLVTEHSMEVHAGVGTRF